MQVSIMGRFIYGFVILLATQCFNANAQNGQQGTQSHSNFAVENYKRTHAYELKYDANRVPFIEITFANPFSEQIHMLTVVYSYTATDTVRKGKQKILADIPSHTNFEKCKLFFTKEELPLISNSKDLKINDVTVFELIYNNGGTLRDPHQLFEKKNGR